MATVEFVFNNKIHTAMKLSLFKVNYGQELRIYFEIRKKKKHMKVEEFVKKMKETHKEAKVMLKKSQKKMKNIDKNRKEAVEYRVGDRVLLSTKDLVWQIRDKQMKKSIEKFVGPYKIKKIILENVIELELPVLMKIYLVVNMSRMVLY